MHGVMVATHAVGRHGSGASDGDRTAEIGGAVTLVNTDLKSRGGEGVDVEVEERRHRMSRSRRAAILQDPVAN